MKSGVIRLLCGSAAVLFLTIDGSAQQDPRVGLKAGLRDAGQAARHMELVASLPKPEGFFDPTRPEGEPTGPETPAPAPGAPATPPTPADQVVTGAASPTRSTPGLNFANSDLAFSGSLVFIGNFNGFNTYDIETREEAAAVRVGRVPGRSGGRVGARAPPVHVGRADAWTD